MKLVFLGGTGTVTGSKFLVETGDTKLLIDCGLFQGYKWLRERNRQSIPFDIAALDAVVLTHAHLDHSGYVPVLYRAGFRGPVFTHHASVDLCRILLADSGHLQEEDAKFYARHKLGRHERPQPLYTRADAEACMTNFRGVDFGERLTVGGIGLHLQAAGHIVGAASVILEADRKRIGFSGDVGRPDDLFMKPPEPLPSLDVLLLEATYGNRCHESADPYEQLASIVNRTAREGGALLIPAFAVGRAQLLMHMLTSLMAAGTVPTLPVYLDSPMAIDVSDIYCRHSAHHKLTHAQCQRMCRTPIYTRGVEESKALAGQKFPHVIIAGSGMATGGRILHHLKRLLPDRRTTVLFTGYQAGGTRGAKMLAGADQLKIHGQWVPVRATVAVMGGLSGHGDRADIGHWLQCSALDHATTIQLVHGEPDALEGMREHLERETAFRAHVATEREVMQL